MILRDFWKAQGLVHIFVSSFVELPWIGYSECFGGSGSYGVVLVDHFQKVGPVPTRLVPTQEVVLAAYIRPSTCLTPYLSYCIFGDPIFETGECIGGG
jgi:hypothetical protein